MLAPRRLNEADAAFVVVGEATGTSLAPVAVTVYEKPYEDPAAIEHLNEVMARLLPPMRQRITRDRFSTASPRWEHVPGFDPADQIVELPAPGDGSLRAVLDWAQEWSRHELPMDRPPWRSVTFSGVTVDGVPDRMVVVSQFHHALMDGQGAARLAEHFYQWAPDGPLPEMPPPVEPDRATPWESWRAGWAQEGAKARGLARNTGRRLRWAASDPSAGVARARELSEAMKRLVADSSPTPLSPLFVRTSDRYRFDHLRVDLDALRAGARAVGGSANDGLMGAVGVALHRYHLDRGVKVRELRTAMPISTRTDADAQGGNQLVAAVIRLPLMDDASGAVKTCQELSRKARDDEDVLWLGDRMRALCNRMPRRLVARLVGSTLNGIDLSLSNVKGMPVRNWIGGVEALETVPFIVGGPAVAITMLSGPAGATIGAVTCPDAIPDPDHLMDRIAEGLAEVTALRG